MIQRLGSPLVKHGNKTLNTILDELESTSGTNIAFVKPEDFGAVGDNVTDDTAAINAMFASGKTVFGDRNKVYKVTGIINTSGQKIVGELHINSTRRGGMDVIADSKMLTPDMIRMAYVSSAYDFCEMCHLKSFGFNTIHHYIDWLVSEGDEDANGTVSQLLDNCLSAGIRVQLKTESTADFVTFINTYQSHPAVFSFSVYDEPATRGFTVAQQKTRTDAMRAITNKPLTVVDLAPTSIFKQALYDGYDIAFVDSYALNYATGSLPQWLEQDLSKHRNDLGYVKYCTKAKIVIPVVSSFIDNEATPYYSVNKQQIVNSSSVFGKTGDGSYGLFLYDGHRDMKQCLRQTPEFQAMAKKLAQQGKGSGLTTDVVIFGGTAVDGHWPLQDIISKCQRQDVTSSSDPFTGFNAYPVHVKTGASNTDRTTTTANYDFSGIGFKGAVGGYNTNIKANKKVNFVLEYFGAISDGTLTLKTTSDGGYTVKDLYVNAVGTGGVSRGTSNPEDIGSKNDTLVVYVSNTGDTTTNYRKFVRGMIVTSDW